MEQRAAHGHIMTYYSPYAPCADAMPRRLVAIIDDSLTIRKIVEVTFAREGYQVLGFGDGVTALRYLLAMAGGNEHGPAQGPLRPACPAPGPYGGTRATGIGTTEGALTTVRCGVGTDRATLRHSACATFSRAIRATGAVSSR